MKTILYTLLIAVHMIVSPMMFSQPIPVEENEEYLVTLDIAVLEILSPLPASYTPCSGETVSARIANLGTLPVDSFSITLNFNNPLTQTLTTIVESYTDTLQPGDTINYTFQDPISIPGNNMSSSQQYHLCVTTDFDGELLNTNNYSCEYYGITYNFYSQPYPYGSVNAPTVYGYTYYSYVADWWMFTSNEIMNDVSISLCGSSYDTQLAVFGSSGCGNWHNDDACGSSSRIDIPLLETGTYYVKVYGWQSAFGNYQLSIAGSPLDSQMVALPSGWSMFSTYIDPLDNELDSILSSVSTNVIIAKDWLGQAYWPQYNLNQIGNIVKGHGYEIKMTTSDTMVVSGQIINPVTEAILLQSGWNILGFLRTTAAPTIGVTYSILGKLEILKNSVGQVYWPGYAVNQIDSMKPGQAYKVKMNSSALFSYPADTVTNFILFSCGNQIFDYNGNMYNTVQIGQQCWMKENLKATHYSDGTPLTLVSSNALWQNLSETDKAYCYFNNSLLYATMNDYGLLYTWPAAVNGDTMGLTSINGIQGICPQGWHLPSDEESKILEGTVDSLYDYPDAEWDLKGRRGYNVVDNLRASTGWPYADDNDPFGFTLLPAGFRKSNGSFTSNSEIGFHTYLWTSTPFNSSRAWYRYMNFVDPDSGRSHREKDYGNSVRCVKD